MEEYKLFQGDNINESMSQSNTSLMAASQQDSLSGSTNEPRIQVPRESISRQGSQSSLTENQSCSSEDKNSSKSNLMLPIVQPPDENKEQQPLQDDMVSIIDHDALHLNDLSPSVSAVNEEEVSKVYEKRIQEIRDQYQLEL